MSWREDILVSFKLFVSIVLFIPQRYVLAIMGLFALANSLFMRVCLSMTITQMVLRVAPSEKINGPTCPADPGDMDVSGNGTYFTGRDRYDWDVETQELLLSAFYYGYVITHLPGGRLAEKFGGKWVAGLGLLITSIATALTPFTVKITGSSGLFVLRVIQGLGEGAVTPAFVVLMARWVPPTQRARFGATIFGGSQIGNIFGPFLSGLILADGGDWANVFYFFGGLGVIWFILWTILCYSTPNTHPFIFEKERYYLNKNVVALKKKLDPVPYKTMLTSKPLWSLAIAAIAHELGYATLTTDLPHYFHYVLKLNIKKANLLSVVPFIAMFVCSFIMAYICDLCVRKKFHDITIGRKIYTTISFIIPSAFTMLAMYSGCNRNAAVSFYILSMAFMGGSTSSVEINAMDIAPNYAGTCSAIVNGLAAFSGLFNPYLSRMLNPSKTVAQWRLGSVFISAILVKINVVYNLWGSGKQQWWDDPENVNDCPPSCKAGKCKQRKIKCTKTCHTLEPKKVLINESLKK